MKVSLGQNRQSGSFFYGQDQAHRPTSSGDAYAGAVEEPAAQPSAPAAADAKVEAESPSPIAVKPQSGQQPLSQIEKPVEGPSENHSEPFQLHLNGVRLREAQGTTDGKRLMALVKDSDILVRRQARRRIHKLASKKPFITRAYLENGGSKRAAALETIETIDRAFEAHQKSLEAALEVLREVEKPTTEELRALALSASVPTRI